MKRYFVAVTYSLYHFNRAELQRLPDLGMLAELNQSANYFAYGSLVPRTEAVTMLRGYAIIVARAVMEVPEPLAAVIPQRGEGGPFAVQVPTRAHRDFIQRHAYYRPNLPCSCTCCGREDGLHFTGCLHTPKHRDSSRFDALVEWLSSWYGQELGLFLARRLAKAIRKCGKHNNFNNFRACDKASASETAQYEMRREQGCCGFHDIEITHYPTGRNFRLGFNYGH